MDFSFFNRINLVKSCIPKYEKSKTFSISYVNYSIGSKYYETFLIVFRLYLNGSIINNYRLIRGASLKPLFL